MNYFTPEEIKNNKNVIKMATRSLPLKGRVTSIFKDHVKSSDAVVLDVGTGRGFFLSELFKGGYKNLYACDIDNYLSEEVKPILKNFQAIDLNFEKLPWPDNFFDAITAWEVLEHLENPHNAIREINRVLKPGALFMFSVPNIFHIVSRLIFLKRGVFPRWNMTNNHISVFPHGIFEKAFLKYFNLIKEGYVYSKIALPFLNKIKFLPENKWFSSWVYYILKKK
ncbi:MAG: class I SAM-dependent methyltransferase [Patescibacteria group bacterium]